MLAWIFGSEEEEVVYDSRQRHLKYLVCETIKNNPYKVIVPLQPPKLVRQNGLHKQRGAPLLNSPGVRFKNELHKQVRFKKTNKKKKKKKSSSF